MRISDWRSDVCSSDLSKPSKVADNPLGDWNTMKIKMVGEKVTVHLNGELVVDNVTLENYWDRNQSIFPVEQIERSEERRVGKSVSVRVDLGGRSIIKKKKVQNNEDRAIVYSYR